MLVRANGYSFGVTAQIMGIQKATVQTLVKRAEDKISEMVEDLTIVGLYLGDVQLLLYDCHLIV